MLADDPLQNVLFIDLTNKKHWVEQRPELFRQHLGGAGAASQLLLELCPAGADPLSPENPVIFAVGPLTGLFPLASKTVAMFKSPHTGNLGESHAGGRSAVAIRMAGYGAVVITGANREPGYLAVHGGGVHFRDAAALWGMENSVTVGRVIRENEPGAGVRTIMRIGVAGENLVTYACVTTESYRHFGRLGLGAVFGSKKLKAVVVSGQSALPVADFAAYRSLYETIYRSAVESPVMKKYHDLGTPENIAPLNKLGALPVRNLSAAADEQAAKVSGESMAGGYLGRRLACGHCPVGCIHIAALREPYETEKYFYKTSMIGYDYEPTYAMGTMLGVFEPEALLKLLDAVEKHGIDSMSAGVALAWATEAREKGLVSDQDLGGVPLAWGDHRSYLKALSLLVHRTNPFYDTLAGGVDRAAQRYGGADFALAFGGNEMAGYHAGPGTYIGYMAGARHSHLDNAGYSLDQKHLSEGVTDPPAKIAGEIVQEEQWRQVLSSLVVCYFARGIYGQQVVLDALRCAGFELDADALKALGKNILGEKYRFKFREGFSFENLRIPRRILETAAPGGAIDEQYIRDALQAVKAELTGG